MDTGALPLEQILEKLAEKEGLSAGQIRQEMEQYLEELYEGKVEEDQGERALLLRAFPDRKPTLAEYVRLLAGNRELQESRENLGAGEG